MTESNKPADPFDVFGGLINGVLGSALGETAKGKPVNPLIDTFFSKAESVLRSAENAANAPRPRPEASAKPSPAPQPAPAPRSEPTARRVQEGQTSYDPFGKNKFSKPEAPKENVSEPTAQDAPFGGIDLPGVIEDVVAFGQGTFHGLGDMLGFGGHGQAPFAGPDFVHAFKGNSAPPVDIISRANSVEYRLAVAGVKPENVSVELDGELLTIIVNTPKNLDTDEAQFVVQEIWSGNWEKKFNLPAINKDGQKVEIDEEGVKASVKDGLVSVLVPFKERVKTKITVS